MKSVVILSLLLIVFPLLASNNSAQVLQNFTIQGRYFYGELGGGPVTGVCVDDHFLYVTENFDSLRVFDISSTDLPTQQIGVCPALFSDHIFKSGNLVIGVGYSKWNGYKIFDVSNPRVPSPIFNYACGDVILHVKVDHNILYTPLGNDFTNGALKAYDISDPANPIMIDYINPGDGAWGFDFDIYGNTGYNTFFYAGLAILDLSDPYDIRVLGHIPEYLGALKVYGSHLFLRPSVLSFDGLLRIYGLNNPEQPAIELSIPTSLASTSDLEIINGVLYACDVYPNKVILFDIGGFDYPDSLGAFQIAGEIHNEGYWLAQLAIKDRIAYFAAGDSGLYVLRYTGSMPINTGDANNSGNVNGIDVIYMANYLKYGGSPPSEPRERGDTNGDCVVNGLDVVYLVNYLKGGPAPVRGFCYGP